MPELQAKAVARHIRVSPFKARLLVDMIRGKNVDEAEAILRYTPNQAKEPILKVLKSAIANAEQNLDLNRDRLYVSQAFVDEGPSIKRFKPRAQGRADHLVHRTSHITVAVGEREEDK